MAQYVVPKFIEHKPKIVGPFTFEQFLYIGGAGAVSFILYFTLGKSSFFLFILAALPVMLAGLGLAFGQVGGRSLPIVLKNFFAFTMRPKIYLWKKKTGLPPKLREEKAAAEKSKLKDLSTHVETSIK